MGNHACDRVMRLCAIVAFLAALAGCSGRSTNPEDVKTEPTIHDPWQDEEAELLALRMSYALCAPQVLYDQVSRNLAAIRAQWGDSIPNLRSITYTPYWSPSRINLGVDDDAFHDMEAGTYTAWDSLNDYYHGEVLLRYPHFGGPPGVTLKFAPRLNPDSLTHAYAGLPGVRWIQPDAGAGDWPNVYGYLHGTEPTYLFRSAWGDCPAGCIISEFWYFRACGESVEFVGHWFPSDDTNQPNWWDEAYQNWEDYYSDEILWKRGDTPDRTGTDYGINLSNRCERHG